MNLRKIVSKLINSKLNKNPINIPTKAFVAKIPTGLETMKAVMKNIEIMVKKIRINARDMFIIIDAPTNF